MSTIEVDWPGSHDAADDASFVMAMLEAGYDEGPLLVVPCDPARSPSFRAAGGPQVFKDTSHYIAHLVAHEGQLSGDRWVGLVRGSERENGTAALAALTHLRDAIAPRKRRRSASPAALDYSAYSDNPGFSGELRIVHVGEYADEVHAAFPALANGTVEIGTFR